MTSSQSDTLPPPAGNSTPIGQPTSSSTVLQGSPQIVTIAFDKINNGIGLSIVEAQGSGQPQCGIYVKKIVPGSAAEKDGRIEAGDQLLTVNGHSLVGIPQQEAARHMAQAVKEVRFEVAKKAAMYNGLASMLYHENGSNGEAMLDLGHQQQNRQTPRQPQANAMLPPPAHQRYASSSTMLPMPVRQPPQQKPASQQPYQQQPPSATKAGYNYFTRANLA